MPKIGMVIPCYNEALRLASPVYKAFLQDERDIHILFVNDGSTDATGEVLRAICVTAPERCGILEQTVNTGKGEAVRQGILQCLQHGFDFIGYFDADLSTPLEAVWDLQKIFDAHPRVKLVMGSRVKLLGRDIRRILVRHYLGRMIATLISMVLHIAIYDTQCGAKLFKAGDDLYEIFQEPFLSPWLFDVEIIARMTQASMRSGSGRIEDMLYEYPLKSWRHQGGSKVGTADGFKALYALYRIRRKYPPCR